MRTLLARFTVLQEEAQNAYEVTRKEIRCMAPLFKKYGVIILSVIVAIAILLTAFITKGTEHENAWLYIVCLGTAFIIAFDAYAKKKNDKGQRTLSETRIYFVHASNRDCRTRQPLFERSVYDRRIFDAGRVGSAHGVSVSTLYRSVD